MAIEKWMIKAAIQKTIGVLPQSHRWNRLFQRYLTKGLRLHPGAFQDKVVAARSFLEHYRSMSRSPRPDPTVLEIGTGWFPVVPISLYLCGASHIRTYDINPLLEPLTLRQTVRMFLDADKEGRLQQLLPAVLPERLSHFRDWAEKWSALSPRAMLELLNIHLHIGDARQSGLPAGSIDFFLSNFCLEHIPDEIQRGLWAEFLRLSNRNSVMSHRFGIKDQYSQVDDSITSYNYLRFSEKQWKIFNNPMSPQTRLRVSDYRRIFKESGFEIVQEINIDGSLEELRSVPLAEEFKKYSEADLLVIWSWMVSRPA